MKVGGTAMKYDYDAAISRSVIVREAGWLYGQALVTIRRGVTEIEQVGWEGCEVGLRNNVLRRRHHNCSRCRC